MFKKGYGGRYIKVTCIFLLFILYLVITKKINSNTLDIDYHYKRLILSALSEPLWNKRDAYNTCHYLMVPMHYAFKNKNTEYINAFKNYFDSFMYAFNQGNFEFDENNGLSKNHHFYFATQYMYLCTINNMEEKISDGLYEYVMRDMINYCNTHTANWSKYQNYENMFDLLENLLYGEGYKTEESINRAITDNELFPLAILCDLYTISKLSENDYGSDEHYYYYNMAKKYSFEIYKEFVVYNEEGGWVFQPGVWKDHVEFKYANVEKIVDIDTKKDLRVDNIVLDSSHFMRHALFLRSFMNGHNGVYKYNINTGRGCEAYMLSRSFLLGWWSFLADDDINNAYMYTTNRFPLDNVGKEIYKDPVTTREQNPIFLDEHMLYLICYCVAELSK